MIFAISTLSVLLLSVPSFASAALQPRASGVCAESQTTWSCPAGYAKRGYPSQFNQLFCFDMNESLDCNEGGCMRCFYRENGAGELDSTIQQVTGGPKSNVTCPVSAHSSTTCAESSSIVKRRSRKHIQSRQAVIRGSTTRTVAARKASKKSLTRD